MNLMQKECNSYSIFLGKKGGVSDAGKNTRDEKNGSGRRKMRLLHLQCQQDFTCLHWSDTGHCWSFLGESPKIAEILAEEKFQQNQS